MKDSKEPKKEKDHEEGGDSSRDFTSEPSVPNAVALRVLGSSSASAGNVNWFDRALDFVYNHNRATANILDFVMLSLVAVQFYVFGAILPAVPESQIPAVTVGINATVAFFYNIYNVFCSLRHWPRLAHNSIVLNESRGRRISDDGRHSRQTATVIASFFSFLLLIAYSVFAGPNIRGSLGGILGDFFNFGMPTLLLGSTIISFLDRRISGHRIEGIHSAMEDIEEARAKHYPAVEQQRDKQKLIIRNLFFNELGEMLKLIDREMEKNLYMPIWKELLEQLAVLKVNVNKLRVEIKTVATVDITDEQEGLKSEYQRQLSELIHKIDVIFVLEQKIDKLRKDRQQVSEQLNTAKQELANTMVQYKSDEDSDSRLLQEFEKKSQYASELKTSLETVRGYLERDVQACDQKLLDLKQQQRQGEERLDALEKEKTACQLRAEECRKKLEQQQQQQHKQQGDLAQKVETYNQQLLELQQQQHQVQEQLPVLEKEKAILRQQIEQSNKKLTEIQEKLQKSEGEIQKLTADIEGLKQNMKKKEKERAETQKKLQASQEELNKSADAKIRGLQKEIDKLEKQREKLKPLQPQILPEHSKMKSSVQIILESPKHKGSDLNLIAQLLQALHSALSNIQCVELEHKKAKNKFGLEAYNVHFEIGDCLFAAIAAADADGRSADEMRQLAVTQIHGTLVLRDHINALAGAENTKIRLGSGKEVKYQTVDEYIEYMEQPQTWGTEIEATALSFALQRPIVILSPNEEYAWIIEQPAYANQVPIFVEYQGNNHYVPLATPKDTHEVMQHIRAAVRNHEEHTAESSLPAAAPPIM